MLHFAAYVGDMDLVEYLLQRGASINRKNAVRDEFFFVEFHMILERIYPTSYCSL